jgi:hypothetical protein
MGSSPLVNYLENSGEKAKRRKDPQHCQVFAFLDNIPEGESLLIRIAPGTAHRVNLPHRCNLSLGRQRAAID